MLWKTSLPDDPALHRPSPKPRLACEPPTSAGADRGGHLNQVCLASAGHRGGVGDRSFLNLCHARRVADHAAWWSTGTGLSPPLVQSRAVPKPDASLSAVIVSGGKQYRVAPGDKILVDRLAAEPGSSLKLGRVLLLRNGDEITVGSPAVDGLEVEVKVLAHRRGPRIESIRYKSKKRVRVHHGGRADLTALEIIAVGGMTGDTSTETKSAAKPQAKSRAKPRAKAVAKKAAPKAEVEQPAPEKNETKPKKRATRKQEHN